VNRETLEAQHERMRREIRNMARRCAVTAGIVIAVAMVLAGAIYKLHQGG